MKIGQIHLLLVVSLGTKGQHGSLKNKPLILLVFIFGKAFADAIIECKENHDSVLTNTTRAIAIVIITVSKLYLNIFALRRKNVYLVQITLY